MKRMFRMSGDVAVFKGWDFDFNNEKKIGWRVWSI